MAGFFLTEFSNQNNQLEIFIARSRFLVSVFLPDAIAYRLFYRYLFTCPEQMDALIEF